MAKRGIASPIQVLKDKFPNLNGDVIDMLAYEFIYGHGGWDDFCKFVNKRNELLNPPERTIIQIADHLP